MRPTPPRARARAREATRSRALATGAIATIAATIGARAVDVDSYFSRSESSAFARATSNGTFAVGCESRNVAGMNFYPLVEFAGEFARASFGFDHGDGRGRAAARDVFKLARESGMSPTALALGFCRSREYVGSTIVGATTLPQLNECIDAFTEEKPLSKPVLKAIDRIHRDAPNPNVQA